MTAGEKQRILNTLYDELKAQSRRIRCSRCKSDIWPAWQDGTWQLRCGKGFDPEWESKPDWQAEALSQMLEKEAKMNQHSETTMLARVNQAQSLGLWTDKGNVAQLGLLAKAALAYGLDPLMQELILYQGKPFITIDGRRRLDANAGHHASIRFRVLTTEEKGFYAEAGALNKGDLAHVCVLTTEHGNTVEAFGRVLARQRDPNQRGADHLPTVQYTIEMSQKRAEARARRMAYGPSPRPALLDHMVIIEEGDVIEDVIEGEIVPATPPQPLPQPAARRTYCDLHKIKLGKHPTEGMVHKLPDGAWCHGADAEKPPQGSTPGQVETVSQFEDTPLGNLQRELAREGWNWTAFEQMVLHMTWPEWVQLGGTIETARKRWANLAEQEA